MNQARSGRYYAEEFEDKLPIPWGLIIALSVLSGVFVAGAAFYGDHRGFERGRAYQAHLARPACPAPTILPDSYTGKSCIEAGRKSYQQCVMERTKARGG